MIYRSRLSIENTSMRVLSYQPASRFTANLWSSAILLALVSAIFIAYVWSERQVDIANEQRYISLTIANDMRQSSDDLTRISRTYVITKTPIFKKHYQQILDIRNGKAPRLSNYERNFWGLQLSTPDSTSQSAVSIHRLIAQADFTPAELNYINSAITQSNQLTAIEHAAMDLVSNNIKDDVAIQQKAQSLLFSEDYRKAKYEIQESINSFERLVTERRLKMLNHALNRAKLLRALFALCGLCLMALLWNSRKALFEALGGSPDQVQLHIARIGKGRHDQSTQLKQAPSGSVMGWLEETRQKLELTSQHNQRLTNLYTALSICNEAIVRSHNQEVLFPKVCQTIVEHGGMKMAWIGLVDESTQRVIPVASHGKGTEYLENNHISVNPEIPQGRGPTGTAIRENQPYWCQDFVRDPALLPWRERGIEYGWGASASIPILSANRPVGALTMYAAEPHAFDQDAKKLLLEMAEDIGYAIDNFSQAAALQRSNDTLLKLSQAVEQSPSTIVITDLDANIEYANSTFTKITGYTLDEVVGKNPRILQSGDTPADTYKEMWEHLTNGKVWRGEFSNRRKDGSTYIESVLISPVRQPDGKITHYLAIKEDITEKKAFEARIEKLAHFDQLTGLPNRYLLNDRFKYAISLAQRSGDQLAVLFIDLDHFKVINDTLGHSTGDLLLMEVATRLKTHLRDEDTVSRLGGDEFMIILPDTDADGATKVAHKLLVQVSQPCNIGHHELVTTLSIGIAIYPHDGTTGEALSKNADTAMYRAKQEGRNTYRFFTQEMQLHSARKLKISSALRHAVTEQQFSLVYQPQVSIDKQKFIGVEALLRWQHPQLGVVSPAEFIPIAEDSGQILAIGEWVLNTAAKQAALWLQQDFPPFVMAINLSAAQFRQANLTQLIIEAANAAQIPYSTLEVELTESTAMDNPIAAIEVMDKLHAQGIQMSIDDFGTGYSSLSYLKRFKAYKLKIDQAFVRDITVDPEDKAIVAAIINMASSLGMSTIAEGVETEKQRSALEKLGCHEMQGYLVSKPVPAEEIENLVKSYMAKHE